MVLKREFGTINSKIIFSLICSNFQSSVTALKRPIRSNKEEQKISGQLKSTQGNKQQEHPLNAKNIYSFLLFLLLWRSLVWSAVASRVRTIRGRGGRRGGRRGGAVVVAVAAAVAVVWRGAGGVAAVRRRVARGAVRVAAAVAAVFSPESERQSVAVDIHDCDVTRDLQSVGSVSLLKLRDSYTDTIFYLWVVDKPV